MRLGPASVERDDLLVEDAVLRQVKNYRVPADLE
jgi:hypothetical protein